MACVACHRKVCPSQREVGDVVVEIGRCPTRGCMALGARSRETGRSMVGIGCLRVFGFVTGEASRRRPRIARSVAAVAGHFHMRASERESGQIVIKGRGYPPGCRVTLCAFCGKPIGYVIRIRGAGEFLFVACQTRSRSACESCYMAVVAGDRRVRARKWEV